MYRTIASSGMLSLLLVGSMFVTAATSVLAQTGRKEEKKAAPKSRTTASSMTGCIDQQDGKYVLIDDRSRDPIANLEAEGFETEGFAKHVGHKVTVRGISNPGGARPTFRVRSVETVSESCVAPSGY
jgi:hypothetical protein